MNLRIGDINEWQSQAQSIEVSINMAQQGVTVRLLIAYAQVQRNTLDFSECL